MDSNDNNISIKLWAEQDRPREKMVAKGRGLLTDAELLTILIGSGTKKDSAFMIAQRLLSTVGGSLNKLSAMNISDLKKIKGIGEATAVRISAGIEIGRRRQSNSKENFKNISSSKDAFELLKQHFYDLLHEEFWVVYLNRANKVIKMKCLSKGGVSGTVADIKLILKEAIECLCSSIVLCHNHPSGNLKPSNDDLKLTNKVKDAALLMDIKVLDHLIIHDQKYFSFADENLI